MGLALLALAARLIMHACMYAGGRRSAVACGPPRARPLLLPSGRLGLSLAFCRRPRERQHDTPP